ncbi:hypothetical protein XELAEV_18016726mg [Xenopus laevis]|uniref:CCHC-type domain-containing protein n=1 Tax=Xenopus laevis TaxID=8355 RepID=A0A974HS68_XENLA|nr:hypothetical protein XELAEV_18016726mg [Xenopus laevis]
MSGESPGRGRPSGGESPGRWPTLQPSSEANPSQTPSTARGSDAFFDPAKHPGDEGFASSLAKGLNMLERKRREISKLKSLLKSNISTCSRLNSLARPKRKAEIQRQQQELRDLEAELALLSEGVGAMQERYTNLDRFSLEKKERKETTKTVAGSTVSAREEAVGVVPRSSASGESMLAGGQRGGQSQSRESSPRSASQQISGMLKEIRAVESPEHLRADLMVFSAEEIEAIDPKEVIPKKKKGKKKERQESRFVFFQESSESGVEEATAGKMAPIQDPLASARMLTRCRVHLSPVKPGSSQWRVQEGRGSVTSTEEEEFPPLPGPGSGDIVSVSQPAPPVPPVSGVSVPSSVVPIPAAPVPTPLPGSGKNIIPTCVNEGGSVGPGPSEAGVNYAAALKSSIKSKGLQARGPQDRGGACSSEGPPRRGRVSDPGKRQNVVRLQRKGECPSPSTAIVVDKILAMGFGAEHLNCFVHNTIFQKYTISFVRPQELDEFWARAVTRPLVVEINIILENESIPPADLKVWLSRYGKVMGELELEKELGYKGIWMGGRKVKLQLHSRGQITQHIPNSAYIGKDLICCSYPGQPRHFWKCGSTRHLSISCDVLKCAMCLGVGHVAKVCPQSIRCNLCGTLGHAYSNCPSSWHKIDEEFQAQNRDVIAAREGVELPESRSFPGSNTSRGGKVSRGRWVLARGRAPPGSTMLGMVSCSEGEQAEIMGKGNPPARRNRPQRPKGKNKKEDVGPSEWIQVGDKVKSPRVVQTSPESHCISTSNKFSPLSWGERVEREKEINMELERMRPDDCDADLSSDGCSGLEEINMEEAERLPLGLSAKRECSDDDRKIKKRAETAAS